MNGIAEFSPTELRILRACRMFLVVTLVLALFTGVLVMTLKPVLPRTWADVCVPFGIAELVYAALAAVILAVWGSLNPRRVAGKPDPAKSDAKKDEADQPKEERSDPATASPDFPTVVAFVSKLFGALLILGVVGIALYVSGEAASAKVAPFWFDFGRLAGTGLLVALGFFAAGTLFGFLFGLPKSGHPKPIVKVQTPVVPPGATNAPGTDAQSAVAPAPAPAGEIRDAAPVQDQLAIPDDNTNLEEVSDWLTKIIVGVGLVELKDVPHGIRQLSDFFIQECGNELCGGIFVMMGVFFFIIGFISSYVLARVYLKLAITLTNRFLESPAQATANRAKAIADRSSGIALVDAVRDTITMYRDSVPGLEEALRTIEVALKDIPNYPVALVEKGRALRRLSELKHDPQLLVQAVEVVNRARELTADNYAPAVYNAACYKALQGQPVANFAADLRKAFALNPGLKAEARRDPDFASVRGTPEFQELVKEEAAGHGRAT
ncbi:MAG: hypothetical protein WA414_10040 [Acidobacteriaceae bacterium]